MIISVCASADTKLFFNAAENSLALLFNYMWRYVFNISGIGLKFTILLGNTT